MPEIRSSNPVIGNIKNWIEKKKIKKKEAGNGQIFKRIDTHKRVFVWGEIKYKLLSFFLKQQLSIA